ncbi:MAG: hypothetical protein HY561_07385, partial [Gemmatimonadetes bacterium]|nr:hypothetical protein [Gemmatimonadota bacterium]
MSRASPRMNPWRLAVPGALALLWLAACKETEIPSAPEEEIEPAFNAAVFDRSTLVPAEGTSALGVGTLSYKADVAFQRTATEAVSKPSTRVGFWIETHKSLTEGDTNWEGDLVTDSLPTSASSGETTFQGSVRVPSISPFCGAYDQLRFLTNLALSDDAVTGESVWQTVTGTKTQTQIGPCVYRVETVDDRSQSVVWGEPIFMSGRGLSTNPYPRLFFTGGFEALLLSRVSPVGTYWHYLGWVPVGATSGSVSAFQSGVATSYGKDVAPSMTVATGGADFFEPNDT